LQPKGDRGWRDRIERNVQRWHAVEKARALEDPPAARQSAQLNRPEDVADAVMFAPTRPRPCEVRDPPVGREFLAVNGPSGAAGPASAGLKIAASHRSRPPAS
jgi:hypothetical protein